jgi:phage shock protein PspC (stress-responsive transcriptional regulator)
MVCVRCSQELGDGSLYCRFCGAAAAATPRAERLVRLPRSGRIAGVCAGVAAYLDADVTFVRLAWVLLSIVPGGILGGIIAYAAAWLLLPEASAAEYPLSTSPRLARSESNRRIAGVCGGLADYFGVDATMVRLIVAVLTIYPGAILLGVAAYLMAWLIIPSASQTSMHPAPSTA